MLVYKSPNDQVRGCHVFEEDIIDFDFNAGILGLLELLGEFNEFLKDI